MPLRIRGLSERAAREAQAMLERVGLAAARSTAPANCRAASASAWRCPRAGRKPACVLADEPTGNLDDHTAGGVYDLMLELSHAGHELRDRHARLDLAGRCDRICGCATALHPEQADLFRPGLSAAMWIDTHCHLDASEFDADRAASRTAAARPA
jgi:predicted ABC-type transport system involved in lysophospholipase L1 biosynthesis ATPase subunit